MKTYFRGRTGADRARVRIPIRCVGWVMRTALLPLLLSRGCTNGWDLEYFIVFFDEPLRPDGEVESSGAPVLWIRLVDEAGLIDVAMERHELG